LSNLPDPKVGCHHTGFTKKCHALVTKGLCRRWVQIQGNHPQTGERVSYFDCIDNWSPLLLLEVAQQCRQGGAATESFRNEFVRESARTMHTMRQMQTAAQMHIEALAQANGPATLIEASDGNRQGPNLPRAVADLRARVGQNGGEEPGSSE
jgi:hypothetical protein